MQRLGLTLVAVLGVPWCANRLSAAGQAAAADLPHYAPAAQVTGTLRLWGHGSTTTDFMRRLVTRWEAGFARYQPAVRFDYRLYGTASAVGALYCGAGDIAFMGEEVFPAEESAYERATGLKLASVRFATGSYDVRNFDFSQMLYVNRENPLAHLTLAQIDAAFGTERRLGAPKAIRTWGDLGLTGPWAGRPVHLYGWGLDNDFWIFLGDAAFGGSHRFRSDIREYSHLPRRDGTIYDAGQQILDDLAHDPLGLAISNARYERSEVKAVPVSASADGPFVAASPASAIDGTYPLTRYLPAAFTQKPGEAPEPLVREFLTYILSREGQDDVAQDREYLPLSAPQVAAQCNLLQSGDRPATPLPSLPSADDGLIRISADDALAPVLGAWEDAYRRREPGVRFDNRLQGTNVAIAGLYTHTADLAFLGRSITPVESMAFAWVTHFRPAGFMAATGSLDKARCSPALALVVNRQNPLRSLTTAQIDAVFSAVRKRNGSPVATWRDLGVEGPLADHPVQVHLPDAESGTAVFFRDLVMKGTRKWAWDRITEHEDSAPNGPTATGTPVASYASPGLGRPRDDAAASILRAVGEDSDAIGLVSLAGAGPNVKVLAIDDGSGPVMPTAETVESGAYLLSRRVYAYAPAKEGEPLDPRTRDFLHFVMSHDGQAIVEASGLFLPLPPSLAAAEDARIH